jgi:hypothetical protein
MTFFDLGTGNHLDGAPHLRGQEASIEETTVIAGPKDDLI